MARKKKGELPSGNIRRQIYDHSELVFDENGLPVIDQKTGKQKKKRIYKSITASSTTEANLIKAEIKSGKKKIGNYGNLTLSEAIDKYIESSDSVLSPSTIRGYRTIQRNSFKMLMPMQLSKINNAILKEAVNAECKRTKGTKNPKKISSKTVCNSYGLICTVLNNYAPEIDYNVTLPQLEHNKHELSPPDVIYNIFKGTEMELPVMLAMWLSFTMSEIQGLTKSKSLSSDGWYITIKEVLVKNEHNEIVVKNKGKQPARDRTLRLPEYIKGLIDKVPTDKIITLSGAAITQRFAKAVKRANIPHMTFHDLRHVNASVMALLNVPDKYAQERGGWHSDAIMKNTYMQTFSSERIAVDDQIDNYMSDVIFNNSAERIKEKKYNCWLTLFDKKDNKENKELFDKFCKENNINI